MSNMVIYVDTTRKAPRSRVRRLGWILLAVLSTIAFGIFVFRPDLIVLP